MSVRACSTCRRWDYELEPHFAVGKMFGKCELPSEDYEPAAVMLVGGAGPAPCLYTRCDFNCGWWEVKS